MRYYPQCHRPLSLALSSSLLFLCHWLLFASLLSQPDSCRQGPAVLMHFFRSQGWRPDGTRSRHGVARGCAVRGVCLRIWGECVVCVALACVVVAAATATLRSSGGVAAMVVVVVGWRGGWRRRRRKGGEGVRRLRRRGGVCVRDVCVYVRVCFVVCVCVVCMCVCARVDCVLSASCVHTSLSCVPVLHVDVCSTAALAAGPAAQRSSRRASSQSSMRAAHFFSTMKWDV